MIRNAIRILTAAAGVVVFFAMCVALAPLAVMAPAATVAVIAGPALVVMWGAGAVLVAALFVGTVWDMATGEI